MSKPFVVVLGVLLLLVAVIGLYLLFGGPAKEKLPKLVAVEGVVTLNETPLSNVQVQFLPDPLAKILGGPAIGMTDENGRFVLYYRGNPNHPGSVIGKSRVILTDTDAIESAQSDNPMPWRFSTKYEQAATTDLSFVVEDKEKQEFEVKVEAN